MVAYLAYRQGWLEDKKKADDKRAGESTQEKVHPGGAIVMMFPDGKININAM